MNCIINNSNIDAGLCNNHLNQLYFIDWRTLRPRGVTYGNIGDIYRLMEDFLSTLEFLWNVLFKRMYYVIHLIILLVVAIITQKESKSLIPPVFSYYIWQKSHVKYHKRFNMNIFISNIKDTLLASNYCLRTIMQHKIYKIRAVRDLPL